MKIDRYISIPKRKRPYVSYLQFFLSLSSGVLAIVIRQMYQWTHENDIYSLIVPFSIYWVLKTFICLNYLIRKRKSAPLSVLETLAKVRLQQLFIPSFIKTMLYICYILASLSYNSFLLCILVILNLLVNEFMSLRKRHSRKVNIFNIIYYILMIVCYILNVDEFSFHFRTYSIIFIIIMGIFIPVSFHYLQRQIFHIYQPQIDELLTKQYIIQTLNSFIIILILALTDYRFSINFHIIIEKPFLIIVFGGLCLVYEYIFYEMLFKLEYKYIFMTQVSSIIWLNLYIMIKQHFSISLYFSTFFGIIALLFLLGIINTKKIKRFIYYIRTRKKQLVQQQLGQ